MPTPSELMLLLFLFIFVFVILSFISLLSTSPAESEKNIYKKQKLLIASAFRPPPQSLHRYAQQACYYYYFVLLLVQKTSSFSSVHFQFFERIITKLKRNSLHISLVRGTYMYKYHYIVVAIRILRTTISTRIREKARVPIDNVVQK